MNGLFIVNSDYDSLVEKGVARGISERREDGFLQTAITIHPFALQNRELDLAPGVRLIEIKNPDYRGWRPVQWALYLAHICAVVFRLTSLVGRYEIDFVRAQDPYYCGLIGLIVARLTGRKFCISIHADYDRMDEMDPGRGAPRIFGSRTLAKRLERFLLMRVNRLLAISQYIADYASRNGASEGVIRLFRHMVNTEDFSTSPSPKNRTISVVSRLSLQKYILDVARIARELSDRAVAFSIEIAGDGEDRERLESLLRDLHVDDRVALLGFQNRKAVANLLGRSSINLCLCGGASLIEAGMVGRPSVAYDWEWHREVVVDGATGRVVDEGDWKAAAAAIAELLEQPEQAAEMGRSAGAKVRAMYDRRALLAARREVYRELVG